MQYRPSVRFDASAPLPKFAIHRSTLWHELRKQRGTASYLILVPLIDLKFLNELAAGDAGTSNRPALGRADARRLARGCAERPRLSERARIATAAALLRRRHVGGDIAHQGVLRGGLPLRQAFKEFVV